MTSVPEWRQRAHDAILDLLGREHAAIWPEIEAKLEPQPGFGNRGKGIDPHHLEYARRELRRREIIREVPATTRGASRVAVLTLASSARTRTKTVVDAAAGRKRLLQGRHMGWTRPSKKRPSLIGRAGEDVAHASLEAAVLAGVPYRLEARASGGTPRLFGGRIAVPGGPRDDAAYFAGFAEDGTPILATLLIEVKNVRHWMYPADWEIFQLLDKAARLQAQFPDRGFVPILVARRVQYLTFLMAEELGFRCFYFNRQPIVPHSDVSDDALAEVVTGLGYDIVKGTGAYPKITEGFARLPAPITQTASIDAIAARWHFSAPLVERFAPTLRDDALIGVPRFQVMDQFRQACADELKCAGAWLGQRVLGTVEDEYGYDFDRSDD